ncbi:N-acetylmuramoyl-L-alanine amidase [Terribacillus saccharophilus]|uniref:N-acetylmuramoyl-L-alanine amidase n=1 Tax=Terribacillus saccharophilus TaxID=361277 RepID=UPI003982D110
MLVKHLTHRSLLVFLIALIAVVAFMPATGHAESGTIDVSTSLNVRAEPSNDAEVIGKLQGGQAIEIKEVNHDWGKIDYYGQEGYISMVFVSGGAQESGSVQAEDVQPVSQSAGMTEGYVQVATSLNVRSTPDMSADVVDSLYNGNSVSILSIDNNWAQIEHDGTTGYVSMDFISTSENEASSSLSPLKGKTIVIDAGHGGKDSGAIGDYFYEKSVVLAIALKTEAQLRNLGANVIMTRDDDTFVALESRAAMSNAAGASMFVSIHLNATSADYVNGTEVYYYPDGDTSVQLASTVQENLSSKLGSIDRGTQAADFSVLRNTNAPAILAEVGYITNSAEAADLATDSYQEKAATGIVQGLENYYQ